MALDYFLFLRFNLKLKFFFNDKSVYIHSLVGNDV